MVDVPVLQVTIDDAQYEAFVDRVKQFRADEAETPKAWGETAGHVDEIQKRFAEMAEALAGQAASSEKNKQNTKDAADGASTIGSAWGLMQVSARRFGGSLGGVTRDVVKWERAVTLFMGLTGAGSLYGLDKLASVAAARRRSAGGLGITPGQQAAFQVGFGRLGDPDALLAGFNRAAIDRVGPEQVALAALGVNPAGKNAYKLATETLPKIKRLAESTEDKMLGPTAKSYGLESLGVDESTMRLLKRMSQTEFAELMRTAQTNENPLDIPDSVGRAWQDLITQLDLAQTWLQTALADKLVLIEPGVSKLSDGLVGLIDKLLDKKDLSKWLDEVNTGIEAFARTIGADSGQAALKKALDHLKMSREDFAKLEKWFGDHGTELKLLMLGYAGYKAFTLGRTVGAVVGFGARAAGAAVGVVTSPVVAGAGAALVASTGAANAGEDEAARQRKYHQDPAQPKLPGAGGVGMRGRGNQDVPAYDAQHVDGDMSDRSKREMSGINKPLAEDLVEAAKQSGIKFEVNQGRRTQDEANANAAKGIGVKDSQHLYGAAADIVMIDPATGQKSYNRALYQKFYQSFRKIADAKHHENERWLGASGGRWSSDIVHFDQGIGYGQSHAADPYGRAAAPTAEDVAVSRQEVYKSPANPFMTKAAPPPAATAAPSAQDNAYSWSKDHKNLVQNGQWYRVENRNGVPSFWDARTKKTRPVSEVMGAHPNAKPPPTPAVHVTLNTTESQVTVHH